MCLSSMLSIQISECNGATNEPPYIPGACASRNGDSYDCRSCIATLVAFIDLSDFKQYC